MIELDKNFSSTVLEYLRQEFIDLFYLKTNKYELGTILYTKNPYKRTNATIVKVNDYTFTVLTDIGNILIYTQTELILDYLPPVCKRTSEHPKSYSEFYYN